MATIYFDEDSKRNAKEYAEYAHAQRVCDKISDGIEKCAVIACIIVSFMAICITAYILCC